MCYSKGRLKYALQENGEVKDDIHMLQRRI